MHRCVEGMLTKRRVINRFEMIFDNWEDGLRNQQVRKNNSRDFIRHTNRQFFKELRIADSGQKEGKVLNR